MREARDIINHIKSIQKNVALKNYFSTEQLIDDFYKISESIWGDIEVDDIQTVDVRRLSEVYDFLLNEVIKIHTLEIDDYNKDIFQSTLNLKNIKRQLHDAKRAANMYYLNNEDCEYYFVGDLHSDTVSLKRILHVCDFFKVIVNNGNIRLVFLGDYVDRGKAHLKTVELILLLKYIFPNNIYLLRGNHDGGKIEDGTMKLCVGREKSSLEDYYFALYIHNFAQSNSSFKLETVQSYLNFFDSMCNIALLSYKGLNIIAVHGGLPRPDSESQDYYAHLTSISDLTNEEIFDHNNRSIRHNMFWSDPDENDADEVMSSARFKFYHNHFTNFMDRFGLDILLRGHEAEKDGYKEYYNGRLFTLFSSGIIINTEQENINAETAYKEVKPKILKLTRERELVIVDINLV